MLESVQKYLFSVFVHSLQNSCHKINLSQQGFRHLSASKVNPDCLDFP